MGTEADSQGLIGAPVAVAPSAQMLAFGRAYYRCALRPALTRGIPLYAAVLLVGQVVLPAIPVHQALAAVPAALPLCAVAWCFVLAFVRAPMFGARQTEYLRSLPVPLAAIRIAVVLGLLCLDLPWVLLCLASRDAGVMVTGPVLTAALHVAIAGRRWGFLAAAAAVLAAVVVLPVWLLALPAAALATAGAPAAWAVTRIGRVSGGSRFSVAAPWLGIARALLNAVVLADGQLLRRALVFLALTTTGAVLAIRNNRLATVTDILTACVIAVALGLPIVSVRLTTGIIENGWSLGWLYRATGTARFTRTVGGLAATVTFGAALGAGHGLAVALLVDSTLAWWLPPLVALAGAGLAMLTLGISAAAIRGGAVDASRLAAGHIAATAITALTLGATLNWGLLLPLLAGAAILYHSRVAAGTELAA